jgi:hypothetical protein
MLNTNHKRNGVKTKNDRRICTLYTAQQKADDLLRDGMGGKYFPNLYKWLLKDGYAFVTEFLYTFKIPNEFNPAGSCQRAPKTSTTDLAIASNLGVVEQEIEDAISLEKSGFAGGFVSAKALENLLESIGMHRRISRIQRVEILNNLGYEYHPALNNGIFNGLDRLFITKGGPYYHLTDIGEITAAYRKHNEKFQFDLGK